MTSRFAELVGLAAGLVLWTAPLLLDRPIFATEPAHAARNGRLLDTTPVRGISPSEEERFEGTVIGQVTDDRGNPIEQVAVFVRPLALTMPPVVEAFTTDVDGRFRVSGLPPGRYSFVAIHGHHPPGAMEAVPVFPESSSGHPGQALVPSPSCEPRPSRRSVEGPHAPGVHWRAGGCVEVDIVLDIHNLLEA